MGHIGVYESKNLQDDAAEIEAVRAGGTQKLLLGLHAPSALLARIIWQHLRHTMYFPRRTPSTKVTGERYLHYAQDFRADHQCLEYVSCNVR